MTRSVAEGYRVQRFSNEKLARRWIINPRRPSSLSLPLANWYTQTHAQDDMFEQFGLDDLIGCSTGEMFLRPIPHIFQRSEVAALTALYERWAPEMLQRIFAAIVPPIQTYNRTSRLGWPFFRSSPNKVTVLRPYFTRILSEGAGLFSDAFTIMNVRLQAEGRSRKRIFHFVSDEGVIFERTIGEGDRIIPTGSGDRVASRTRLVFNLPIANLLAQILDTAIHNMLLRQPVFHHNLYSTQGASILSGYHFFFDVKHFERHTAAIVSSRRQLIGGRYSEIGAMFEAIPFLCPSAHSRIPLLLWPNRAEGWIEQFASGNSAVAPAQKEVFWALYAEFAERNLGIGHDQALAWVAAAGDSRLHIMNYGDDNVTSGDQGVLRELESFLSDYLAIEEEDPPKFLGFLYTSNGWRLGVKSYLEKTYLNERRPGSNFRRYPCFGWVEKRAVYAQWGVPEIAAHVFPTEDRVLANYGLQWGAVLEQAAEERRRTLDLTGLTSEQWLLGKDWLMTAEEKLATGEFDGLLEDETATIIPQLIDHRWQKELTW
jgi:hypothetical protein